jgi:hypothetical protein
MITARFARPVSTLALACLIALAACSSPSGTTNSELEGSTGAGHEGGGIADPVDLIRGVSEAVDRAGSYRATFTMDVTAQGQTVHMTGAGEFQGDPLRAHVEYSMQGLPGVAYDMEMEVLLDGSTMYMRAPSLTDTMGLPTDWVSMDLDELMPGFRDLAALGSGQNDPSSSIQYLRGVEDAHEVGRETVAGVETTHYRGMVDLEKAYDRLPSDAGRELEAALDQVRSQFGNANVPVDVWLDDEGLLRRMTMSMETEPDAAVDLTMRMRIEIPEYGIEVRIRPPADHDVTDLTELRVSP